MKGKPKTEFDLVDAIGENKDFERLFKLKNNAAFSIAIHQILVNLYDENPNQLNEKQLNLFLVIHLENSGQSGSILNFLQGWFPQHVDKVVNALLDIGASKSAVLIEKTIKLLPKNGTWLYHTSDEKTQKEFDELDERFSDYPDGNMNDLYRTYAEKYKQDFINI